METAIVGGAPLTPEEEKAKRDLAIVNELIEKRDSYPGMWKEIYAECQKHEDFALLGKQMSTSVARKYGFNNVQMPNLLKPYINNQANQTLQNNYRAVVSPNGGGSDVTKARQREQALRGIQRNGAAMVFNQARRYQLAAGIHYSRIVVDYASDRGFANEYRYEDVLDTYNIFPDPYVLTATFSDMRDFLIKEDVPKASWKERTGEDWKYGTQPTRTLWYYWKRKEARTEKEFMAHDGSGVLESEIPNVGGEPDYSNIKMELDGVTPFSRDVSVYEWEWYMVQDESRTLFTEGSWRGCYPPLIACTGEKVVENTGNVQKVHYYPLTRDAEEPQMVYTILENIILLRLAKSPYSKWKIAFETIVTKQLAEYRKNAVVGDNDIIYNYLAENGTTPLPPPEEIEPKVLDAMLLELQQVQIQKIERVLGIYDAALGQKTNEKSGIAIKERARQSNLANYHFEFNFLEYVKQCGMVVLESMPNYLTAPQQLTFVDNDDKAVVELVNTPGGISFQPGEKYSMVVEVLPDSDTNREAEAEALMKMAETKILGEQILKVPGAGALIVKAQKGRYAQQIGEMMDRASSDPEKAAMKQEIQKMQEAGKKLEDEVAGLKAGKDLDFLKETNRSKEAMRKMELEAAKNADNTEIQAYNAETNRQKVDQIPKAPESILEDDGSLRKPVQTSLELEA